MSSSLMMSQEVEAFVAGYKSVFASLDATRIAAFYTAPCFGLSAEATTAFLTESDVLRNFADVTTQFRAAGLASADHEVLGYTQISSTILQISVKWVLRRADDSVLKHLHVVYVVRVAGPDWRIAVVYGVA